MKIRFKEVFRLITTTRAYFITIVLVTFFGVLTYTGISFSTSSLVQTCEDYYNENQFYDLQLGSLYGFTDEDVREIKRDRRIDKAEPVYYSQELIRIDSNDYVAEFYSKAETLNTEKMVRGRLPEKDDECLIEQALAERFGLEVGDSITLSAASDNISHETFTIVGTADLVTVFTSNDFYNRGTSDLGDGQVTTRIMIPETAFKNDFVKQLCYVTVRNRGYRGSDEYDARIDRLEAALLEKVEAMGKAHRADEKQEYEEKLADKKAEYYSAKAQYDDAKAMIAKADRQLPEKKKELKSKEAKLRKARSALAPLKKAYNAAEAAFAPVSSKLKAAESKVGSIKSQLDKAETEEEREKLQQEYDEAVAEVNSIKPEYNSLLSQKNSAYSAYSSARSKVDAGQSAISSAKSAISKTEAQVKSAKSRVSSAGPQLADAESEIDKAQEKLDNFPKSQVFSSNIHDNASYTYYSESIEGTNTIIIALCGLLMIIAILVCITTVGRMVTEQHRHIGTQKALGFRDREIRSKYVLYVVFAAFVGMVSGALASYLFFQKWVFKVVYGECFIIEGFTPIINWEAMILIFVIESAVMAACAWISCRQMLSRNTIDLLNSNIRSSSYKGKDLSRISNETKMVLRNLRSNPQIMLTTIVSVLGCTVLMIVALTVYHGMSGVSDMQFRELQHYQGTLTADSDAKENDARELDELIEASDINALPVFERFIPYETADGRQYATLIGIDSDDGYRNFLEIKDALTGENMKIPDKGVLICKRMAEKYGFSEGDSIVLSDSMGNQYKTTVEGIFDRYIGMAIISDSDYYADLTDSDIETNQYYIRGSDSAIAGTVSEARKNDAFCNYSDAAYFEAEMDFKMKCISLIVLIILVTTGILSIVVIFDLVQMNIQKKEKDIIVMKVLGYPKKKIFGYVFWESMIMCIIGLIIGIAIGGPLGSYLSRIVEMDSIQFIRGISLFACAGGGIINLVFSLISNLLALRGISKIKMTGSAREA